MESTIEWYESSMDMMSSYSTWWFTFTRASPTDLSAVAMAPVTGSRGATSAWHLPMV